MDITHAILEEDTSYTSQLKNYLGYGILSQKEICINFNIKILDVKTITNKLINHLLLCNNIEIIKTSDKNIKEYTLKELQIILKENFIYNSSLIYSNNIPSWFLELNKIYNYLKKNYKNEHMSRIELYNITSE